MERQATMFDGADLMAPAPSRRDDPATSKLAGKRLAESGKLAGDKERVLRALRTWYAATGEPITAGELGHEYCLGDNDDQAYALCHKRLPDLERAGFAEVCEARECRIRRSKCQTWRPSNS